MSAAVSPQLSLLKHRVIRAGLTIFHVFAASLVPSAFGDDGGRAVGRKLLSMRWLFLNTHKLLLNIMYGLASLNLQLVMDLYVIFLCFHDA